MGSARSTGATRRQEKTIRAGTKEDSWHIPSIIRTAYDISFETEAKTQEGKTLSLRERQKLTLQLVYAHGNDVAEDVFTCAFNKLTKMEEAGHETDIYDQLEQFQAVSRKDLGQPSP